MFLNELPTEYKELAEKRVDECASGVPCMPNLTSAFIFDETPEGKHFWWDVHKAETEEQLPKIPDTDE